MDFKLACLLFFFLAVATCESSPVENKAVSKRGLWEDLKKMLDKVKETLESLGGKGKAKPKSKASGGGCVEVRCPVDPCVDAKCPGETKAICKTNKCGECKAEFFLGDTKLTKEKCATPPVASKTD